MLPPGLPLGVPGLTHCLHAACVRACVQSVCESGQCSVDGACATAATAPATSSSSSSAGSSSASSTTSASTSTAAVRPNEPPALALRVPALASVAVKQGAAYERCADDQDAQGTGRCEPGASASDDSDVDIQAKVRCEGLLHAWNLVHGL